MRLVEGATSSNTAAGALTTVADNVASHGQLLTFPAVNVSKYSEVSILASAPGASTSNSGGVGFWFLDRTCRSSRKLPATSASSCGRLRKGRDRRSSKDITNL